MIQAKIEALMAEQEASVAESGDENLYQPGQQNAAAPEEEKKQPSNQDASIVNVGSPSRARPGTQPKRAPGKQKKGFAPNSITQTVKDRTAKKQMLKQQQQQPVSAFNTDVQR